MKKIFLLFVVLLTSSCAVSQETVQTISLPAELELEKNIEAHALNDYEILEKFNQPWPVKFTQQEASETALAKTFSVFENINTADKKFIIFLDPEINSMHRPTINQIIETTVGPFSEYLQEDINVIVGANSEFLLETVEQNGIDFPPQPGGVCDNNYGACSFKNSSWAGTGGRLDSLDGSSIEFSKMLSHKTLHAIQDSFDTSPAGQIPPRSSNNFRPVWFVEGLAEFYSLAVVDYLNLYEYTEPSIGSNDLKEFEEWRISHNDQESVHYYYMGQAAIEYLVANIGLEGVVSIYLNLEAGQSFEESFKNASGITLDKFYEYFNQSLIK
jgi:hypothetical protein